MSQFGQVDQVVLKGINGKFLGKAIVLFHEREAGIQAMKALNNAVADGRTLQVREVKGAIQIGGITAEL
jgi:RNA recognition motif-containing protein